MRKPETQLEAVRIHLEEFGHLTSLDAIKEYGITRLSDKIYILRKEGLIIKTLRRDAINRFGNPVSYGVYQLNKTV